MSYEDGFPKLEFRGYQAVKAARKEHVCSDCRRTILKGRPYLRMCDKVDGEFRSWNRCRRCVEYERLDCMGDSKNPEFVVYAHPHEKLTPDERDDFYYVHGDCGIPFGGANGWDCAVEKARFYATSDPKVGKVEVRAHYAIWNELTGRFDGRQPIVLTWMDGQAVFDRDALHFNPPTLPDTVAEEAQFCPS